MHHSTLPLVRAATPGGVDRAIATNRDLMESAECQSATGKSRVEFGSPERNTDLERLLRHSSFPIFARRASLWRASVATLSLTPGTDQLCSLYVLDESRSGGGELALDEDRHPRQENR